MMPKLTFLSGLIFLSGLSAIGQKSTMTGKVQNQLAQNIACYVVLMDSAKHWIQSQECPKGVFSFELEPSRSYQLHIEAEQYAFKDTLFQTPTHSGELQPIVLNPIKTGLKEVQIQVQKPMFEKTSDGLKLNVSQTMLSKSMNAGELLTRLPGITLQGNKPQVFGRGEAIIIMNGKETTLESFKTVSPQDIKSIEIISNPGAIYDAKGKAIILVHLKRNAAQGLTVTATLNEQINLVKNEPKLKYLYHSPNLSINFRKNKINLTGYYANEYGINWSENFYNTTITSSQGRYDTKSYYTEDVLSKKVHYYKAGISYELGKRSIMSAQYDGLYHFFDLNVRQEGDYQMPDQTITKIRMQNDGTTTLQNHSVNLNYFLKTDSVGSTVFVGAQFNRFSNGLLDQITENITTPALTTYRFNRRNIGSNLIKLYTLQGDFLQKFRAFQLETGFKLSYATNESEITFLSKEESATDFQSNPQMANSNEYIEKIPAVYMNLKRNWKSFQMQAGVRWEYADITGFSKKINSFYMDTTYHNLFPSAKITYQVNSKCQTYLNYSKKINRPIYQDLDPFLWYLDSLTSIQGNASLLPEMLHQTEAGITYNGFTLRAAYTISNRTIWAINSIGYSGPNSTVYRKENIKNRYITTVALDIPFEKKQYNSFTTLALNHFRFSDPRPGFEIGVIKPQFYVYTYHQYAIKEWIKLDLTGEYYGKTSDGFTIRSPYYYASFGCSKAFLKEQLSVQLLFNDVFRTARLVGDRTINTVNNTYAQRYATHFIRLSATYQISKGKSVTYKNKSVNESEFQRIKK